MNIEKFFKQRHDVLRVLADEFSNELVPAKVVMSDGTDADDSVGKTLCDDTEMLTVLFEDLPADGVDAIGDFFFISLKEYDYMQIFQNVITIDEEVDEEILPDVLMAVIALNNAIPIGAFGVDLAQRSLVYRHSY